MYTVNNKGKSSNYAIEPIVYAATYPAADEQEQYTLQAAIAALFVVSMLLVSFAVS
jgi:hypothetical protein